LLGESGLRLLGHASARSDGSAGALILRIAAQELPSQIRGRELIDIVVCVLRTPIAVVCHPPASAHMRAREMRSMRIRRLRLRGKSKVATA
jgi:hypothetical protein